MCRRRDVPRRLHHHSRASLTIVADSWLGIRAIDVSTPSAPVSMGFYDTPGSASYGVAASGWFVYVTEGGAGVEIFRDCEMAIFSDGFEVGDTSAWSNTVP